MSMPFASLRMRKTATYTGGMESYTADLFALLGLKRYLGSYTGPLLRVRRSSDDAEQDIPFTLAGALDQTTLAAFVGSDSAYVVTWYDQSGNANNFTQATKSAQPRIVNAGTYDGKLVFDNTDYFSGVNAFPSGKSALMAFLKAVRHSATNNNIFFSNANLLNSGFDGFQGYSDSATSDAAGLVSTDGIANYRINVFGSATSLTLGVFGWILDRTQATTAKVKFMKDGSTLTQDFTFTTGTDPTGNFSSDTILLGAQGGFASFADSDIYNFALYTNTSANGAAISAVLA